MFRAPRIRANHFKSTIIDSYPSPPRTHMEQSTDERRAAVIEKMKKAGMRTSAFLDGCFNDDTPAPEKCLKFMMEKLRKLEGNEDLEEVKAGVVAGVGKTLTYMFHKNDRLVHTDLVSSVRFLIEMGYTIVDSRPGESQI
ncbi:hypothetical protein AB1Y20_003442 [Prymnesium parvum]|uniref:Uncharacterized protein n=1 Tax=Prymnesium parvum TaxID=97485 RepID=A0AB34JDE5_PRYPA